MNMQIKIDRSTLGRLWPVLLNVLVTGVALMILNVFTDYSYGTETVMRSYEWIGRIIVWGFLNSCVLVAVYYLPGRKHEHRLLKLFLAAILVLVNTAFAVFYPFVSNNGEYPGGGVLLHYFIVLASYIVALVLLPIWNLRERAQAWYFLYRVLIGGLFAGLVAFVLQVGLSLALSAIATLFNVEVAGFLWGEVAIIVGYIIAQVVFFALLPRAVETRLSDENYPIAILRFTQFVFLPLATVYMLILYSYILRIVITGVVPQNQLIYMILGFLVPSLAAMVLLLPLLRSGKHRWTRPLTAIYSLLSLPLLGLFFYSIFVRISSYGFTVDRLLVVVVGVWFTLMFLYVLIGRAILPQAILVTLPVMILIGMYTPFFNFSTISELSQTGRLIGIMDNYDVLQDQQLVKGNLKVPYEEFANVQSIVLYLNDYHGARAFRALMPLEDYKSLEITAFGQLKDPYNFLNSYIQSDGRFTGDTIRYFYADAIIATESFNIAGYDDLAEFSYYGDAYAPIQYGTGNVLDTKLTNGEQLVASLSDRAMLTIDAGDDSIRFDMGAVAQELEEKVQGTYISVPQAELTLSRAGNKYKVRILIAHMNGEYSANGELSRLSITGKILVGRK